MVLLLLVAVSVVVAMPLLRPAEERRREDDLRAELEAAKEAKYREIRDAEADFRAGKLSQADYRATDRELRAEAIEILRRIDAAGGEGESAAR